MRSLIIACTGALLLGGCATLTAEECTTANWQQLGYTDAVAGNPPTRLAQHYKACTEYGITPNTAQYEAGHAEGARIYCAPINAFKLGDSGAQPANICPSDMALTFNNNYTAGRGLFDRRAAVNQSRDAIYSAEREIDSLENRSTDLQNRLAYGNPPEPERTAIIVELEDNREDRDRLRNDLRRYRDDLRNREDAHDNYRARLEFDGMLPGI